MRTRTPKLLAALVVALLALTACGGDDDGDAGGDGGDATASAPADGGGGAGGTVSVTGTDSLAFEPESLSAGAGTVTVELTCGGAAPHTFVVEDESDGPVVECAGNETATGTVELSPGEYTFFCDVTGHRSAGMEGTLTVEG